MAHADAGRFPEAHRQRRLQDHNFPHEASVADVRKAYMLAYELGCRGITIYRDGSKAGQVLSIGETGKLSAPIAADSVIQSEPAMPRAPRRRLQTIQGVTERVRTGHGNMYVAINYDD